MLDFSVAIYRFTARKTVDDLDEATGILRAYRKVIYSGWKLEPFAQADENSEVEALLSAGTAGFPRLESAGLVWTRSVQYPKDRQGTGSAVEWLFEDAAKREGAFVSSGGYPNLAVCTARSIRTQFAESPWLTERGLTTEQLIGDASDDELIVMEAWDES